MRKRLGIFVFTLLTLPLAGFWISGSEWNDLSGNAPAANVNPPAVLLTTLMLCGYVLLVNHMSRLLTGNNLLKLQRDYLLWMGAASVALAWSLVYLNLFVASWVAQTGNPVMQFLLYTPLFALLAPAVLSTRALLGSLPGLLKQLSRGPALPVPNNGTLAATLASIAVAGLLGGVAWPVQLFWLLWLSPLLLLTALQLIWEESTIFSGLANGDWGRVVFAALSGIIVANFTVIAYQTNGGALEISLPHPVLAQPGFALYGLMCLQLADVIAEKWRGKQRGGTMPPKRKFPIPVIAKKV